MKKATLIKISIFILLQILSFGVFAQTVNEGMLYISPNTEFSTEADFKITSSGQYFNDGEAFIYANFNNEGVVDFYENTGLSLFIGRSPQQISGSKESYLYNIYFNNSSTENPFHLSGKLNAYGFVDFYEGIVDNDNFGGTLTFNTDASHINTSDYSHVDGTVSKVGNKDFTFPIGDGGYYRFGGISAPSNGEAMFKGKFFFENSNDLYSHELRAGAIQEIDNREYWIIEKELNADEEDVLITLSWRDVTTPQTIIDAAEQDAITIVRWDEATNMWVDEGGAIDIDNKTVTTSVSDYGTFTLGRLKADAILPGGLIVYTAVTPNGDGKNDFFFIDNQDPSIQNIHVEIYNRWGVKVFETNNYGESGQVFDGYSNGRLTVDDSEQLPSGTYYYILDYKYGSDLESKRHKQAGFLYLSGN